MKSVRRDQWVGLLLFCIGAYYAWMTYSIPVQMAKDPGPKIFPYMGSICLIICGLGMFFSKWGSCDSEPFFTKQGWKRFGLCLLVMVAFVVSMYWLGTLITMLWASFVLTQMFSKGYNVKLFNKIIYCIVFCLILYFGFRDGFKISLPTSELVYRLIT